MGTHTVDALTLLRVEHAVTRVLAVRTSGRQVAEELLPPVGEALGWEVGAVWDQVRDDASRLRCITTWRAAGVEAGGFERATREARLAVGEGLPGRVWADGAPVWLTGIAGDDNFPRVVAAEEAGFQSAMCVPVMGREGPRGAIEFFTRELREPDDALLRTMENVGHLIGQFMDRRLGEVAVRASEAQLRATLAAALDCVITIDAHGRVVDFNPAAQRVFGYTSEEAVGREMAALIVPPALRERHREGLRRCVAGGPGTILDTRLEITGMRRDGSEFPVELTVTRIAVEGGPLRFTGYVRDITDRKRAEAELRASRARLVAAQDAERQRLERDLHDGAQQRLVGLALALRLAREQLDGSEPAGVAAQLDAAIDELGSATAELRDLARGIHPALLTTRGLEPALTALAGRAPVDVTVDVDVARRLAPELESAAYFVVAEALANVARYARAQRVVVTVACAGGRLHVEVGDDGVGGARPGPGSGLSGLADRVAALDGELEVDSPAGAGTRIRAWLPCAS